MTLNLGFVKAHLVKASEGFVLIDTGMPGPWVALQKCLQAAGCAPGLLKLVVLTHADLDLAGNCLRLRESYGAPIAVHPLDAPALEDGVFPKRTIRTVRGKILFGLLRALRPLDRGPVAFQPFTAGVLLEDGQSLAAYGLAATVIHLPGHTRGSIALLTEDGELFAGDFYTNQGSPALSPYVESFDDYRSSFEKARRLAQSIETVHPGHGAPFSTNRVAALPL